MTLDLSCHSSPYLDWQNWQGKDFAGQVIRDDGPRASALGSAFPTLFRAGDGDSWNGSVRSLVPGITKPPPSWSTHPGYDSPKPGDDIYWAVAVEFGAVPPKGLFWEQHHTNEMAKLAPTAPQALSCDGTNILARCAGGEAIQGGWKTWYPNLYLCPAAPGLIGFIVHVRYARGNGFPQDGAPQFDVYAVRPGKPRERLIDGSTLDLSHGTFPWTNVGPEAGKITTLYNEVGIYPAGNPGRPRSGNFLWHYGSLGCGTLAEATSVLAFGTPPVPPKPPLRKISEAATTIVLEWDPVVGAYGYRFFVDGHPVSVTFDGGRTTARFAKGATEYGVLPLTAGSMLTYKP